MDHRLKCKILNYKISKKTIGDHLCDLGLIKDFLATTLKAWAIKEKIGKLDFLKLKTSALYKTLLRTQKGKP